MQASDIETARPQVDGSMSAVATARAIARDHRTALVAGTHCDAALLPATEEFLARGMGPRSDKGDGDPNQDPDPPMADASSDPVDLI